MSIRLVATDLDGTLLNSDRAVSSRTAAAMTAATEAGIVVVWATARAQHSVQSLAASCGFRGFAVAANGAVILDLSGGIPKVVDVHPLPPHVARDTMTRVRALVPGTVFATVGPTRFVADPHYAALCEFTDHHRDPATMELSPTSVLDTEPIVKIVARHPEVSSKSLFHTVAAAGMPGVTPTHSGAPYLEVAADGVSKASGLSRLCAQWGIDPSEVAACGDAINDLPMLLWAGLALCPANAAADTLAVADIILPSNDDHGVATYLESLVAVTG